MSDFALDPATDDLIIENSDFVLVRGASATAQNLRQRLRLFKGEWYQDLDLGLDRSRIVGKGLDLRALESEIRREALLAPEIVSVETLRFEVEVDRRHVRLILKATTEAGQRVDVQGRVL